MAENIAINEEVLKKMPIEELGHLTLLSRSIFARRYAALQDVAQGAMSDSTVAPKRKYTGTTKEDKSVESAKPRKARKVRGSFTTLAKDTLTNAKTIAGAEWRKALKVAGASNASTILKQLVKQGFAKETSKDNFELAT